MNKNNKKMSKKSKIIIITAIAACVAAGIATPLIVNATKNQNETISVVLDDTSKSIVNSFTLKKDENSDYVATLTPKDNTRKLIINEVKIGDDVLLSQTDYTFENNKLTIKKAAMESHKGQISIKVTYSSTNLVVSGDRNVDIEEASQYVLTNGSETFYDNVKWTVQPSNAGVFTEFGYFMPSASYFGGNATVIGTLNGESKAFEIEIGSFNKVTIKNGKVQSKDYDIAGKVVIPSRIYDNTTNRFETVTTIQTSGFKNLDYMTSVIIPPTITDIEMNAFLYSTFPLGTPALTQVAFIKDAAGNTGIKNIGKGAFQGQINLSTFQVPESLKAIEKDPGEFEQPIKDNAFKGCLNLNTVIIDSSDVANQVNTYNNLLDNADYVKVNKNIAIKDDSAIAKKYINKKIESGSDYNFYQLSDSIKLNIDDVQTSFNVGDAFNYNNLKVYVMNDKYGLIRELNNSEYTVSDMSGQMGTAGEKAVTVTFQHGKSYTAKYLINVI